MLRNQSFDSDVAGRKFYKFVNDEKDKKLDEETSTDESSQLMSYVFDNVLGSKTVFSSPFGPRKVVYCDYTASGRSLKFIEDYIQENVLPNYGSTHTTTSVTSLQTTLFRHEARDIIRNATRAGEKDRVIFTGSGATSAIHKLLHGGESFYGKKPTVVFVDAFAHHSSFLPFKEKGFKIVRINEMADGKFDKDHFEDLLYFYEKPSWIKMACFSAASNITGTMNDVDQITILGHKYDCHMFWDYATAAPYVDINMNPTIPSDSDCLAHKDAIFFSLHKFVGGVQAPGVLIAKNWLFKNNVPSECGGGTVFFVSKDDQKYLQDIEEREEGGTPPIVETIRGGMAMQLKMSITPAAIMRRNKELTQRLDMLIVDTPSMVALGNTEDMERLPILSFNIRKYSRYLHYNYVSALLNDLYGIQSRGGCACAGPYAQDLLGIDAQMARRYEDLLLEEALLDRDHLRRKEEHGQLEILRPGFVRINLPFAASMDEIYFIMSAVEKTCEEGWKLLPQYKFNPETGEWKHHTNTVFKNRQWLQNISYKNGFLQPNLKEVPSTAEGFNEVLRHADELFRGASMSSSRLALPDERLLFSENALELLWFVLPSQAQRWLLESPTASELSSLKMPFTAVTYPLSEKVLKLRKEGAHPIPKRRIIWREDDELLEERILKDKVKKRWNFQWADETSDRDNELIKKQKWENLTKRLGIEDLSTLGEKEEDLMKHQLDKYVSRAFLDVEVKRAIVRAELPDYEPHLPLCADDFEDYIMEDIEKQMARDLALMALEETNAVGGKVKAIEEEKPSVMMCEGNACLTKRKKKSEDVPKINKRNLIWVVPSKKIFSPMIEAINNFGMIKANDKVLVCVSGGKDSLTLLHALRQFQFYSNSKGVPFVLGAVTVDPQSNAYDPTPLIPYINNLGVPYFFEKQDILKQASELKDLNSICSFCSRMKRGRIYATARREGYNVLAMGQHLDDMAESFLMSIFHNGRLRTMKASYTVQEGDLRVVRPLAYVREKDTRHFAEKYKLPVIPENCPACFESPKERHRVKQLLAQQEILYPRLFTSLRTAMVPMMAINKTGVENSLFGKKSFIDSEEEEELSDSDDDDVPALVEEITAENFSMMIERKKQKLLEAIPKPLSQEEEEVMKTEELKKEINKKVCEKIEKGKEALCNHLMELGAEKILKEKKMHSDSNPKKMIRDIKTLPFPKELRENVDKNQFMESDEKKEDDDDDFRGLTTHPKKEEDDDDFRGLTTHPKKEDDDDFRGLTTHPKEDDDDFRGLTTHPKEEEDEAIAAVKGNCSKDEPILEPKKVKKSSIDDYMTMRGPIMEPKTRKEYLEYFVWIGRVNDVFNRQRTNCPKIQELFTKFSCSDAEREKILKSSLHLGERTLPVDYKEYLEDYRCQMIRFEKCHNVMDYFENELSQTQEALSRVRQPFRMSENYAAFENEYEEIRKFGIETIKEHLQESILLYKLSLNAKPIFNEVAFYAYKFKEAFVNFSHSYKGLSFQIQDLRYKIDTIDIPGSLHDISDDDSSETSDDDSSETSEDPDPDFVSVGKKDKLRTSDGSLLDDWECL